MNYFLGRTVYTESVMQRFKRLCLLGVVIGIAGCANLGAPRPATLTLAQVVDLGRQGVEATEVVRRLQESNTHLVLSGSQLAQLREQGVADAVLDYLHQAQLDAARREESRRYGADYCPYDAFGGYGFGPYRRRYGWW